MGKDQELLEAARNGNILVVEKILNQRAKRSGPLASLRRGPGANVQDSSGYSALHHAALNGHKEVVELLLTHEASCNVADCKGSTPLHLASWSGNVDVVRLLLQHGPSVPDVNLTTKDNETALHWAAQYGHTAVVSQLLEHGCDPTIHNAREETALDLAAQYGRLEAVDLLVRTHPELIEPYSRGSGPPGLAYPHTPLHLASRNGHRAVVEVLLRAGVYVNILTGAGTALHEAALCGKLDVVRALLDAGVDLGVRDARRQTVLDLLGQFPEHVVRDIKYVIQRHRNGEMQAEEDVELPPIPVPDTSVGSPYENVRTRSSTVGDISSSPASGGGPLRGENAPSWGGPPGSAEHHKRRTSATSAGSLTSENGIGCAVNVCRRVCEADQMSISSTASSNAGIYLPMSAPTPSTAAESPGSKVSPTPPKKPPRRNLSVSPTHLMTMSVDGSTLVGHHHHHHHHPHHHPHSSPSSGPYEYLCLARSGQNETSGHTQTLGRQRWQPHRQHQHLQQQVQDQYVDMMIRQGNTSYENMIVIPPLRTQNPRRKLRRHPTSAAEREQDAEPTYISSTYITLKSSSRESLLEEQRKSNQPPKLVCPLSPTNYQQPPTPDHPPPSAFQAENSIHERIRPLSQVNEQQEQNDEQQQSHEQQEQEQQFEQSPPELPPKSSPKDSVSDIDFSLELSISSSSDDSGSSCDPISDNQSKITSTNETTAITSFSSLIF